MSIRIPPTPSADSVDAFLTSLAETLHQPSVEKPLSQLPAFLFCSIVLLGSLGLVLHVSALFLTQAPSSFAAHFVALASNAFFEGVGA